ncbi:hypothetical protein LguiA_022061 [Lonicera macranthoides]
MASWIATAAASAVAKTTPKLSSSSSSSSSYSQSNLSFCLSPSRSLRISPKGFRCSSNHSSVVKAQLNEVRFSQWFSLENLFSSFSSFMNTFFEPSVAFKVAVDGPSDAASADPSTKLEVHNGTEANDDKPSSEPSASEESISDFFAQVSSLVKLVDSRDIVELQLKQLDCELTIRKKEALPQPPPPAPAVMMQPPPPQAVVPPPYQAAQPVAPSAPSAPAPSSAATQAPSLPEPKSSNLPPLKSPMAGTFYRCPAPGEPPLVKVGDKVRKGQVLCIIEAMKLMNEIEADRSGTIVEVVAEDGQPVSVDTPLFVIEP